MVATVANEGISADGSTNPMAMKPRDSTEKTLDNNFILMIPTARSHAPMNMNKNNVSDSLGIALRNSSVSYI